MAYAMIHFFPGGTKEQYEAAIAVAHPSRKTLPAGQILHAAGPSEGGWTIFGLFESEASWEKFRDGVLIPAFQAGVPGGFASPPQETGYEVYNLQK